MALRIASGNHWVRCRDRKGIILAGPFASAYQVVIEFARRYPDDFKAIGLPFGGAGTGSHTSQAQYISRELSRQVTAGARDIEGGFISNLHVKTLTFSHGEQIIESTLPGAWDSMAVFRLRDWQQE